MVAGTTQRQAKSSFLAELPKDCIEGASVHDDDDGDEDPWEDTWDRGGSRAGASRGWSGSSRTRTTSDEFEVSQEFEAGYDEFSQDEAELRVGTRVVHAVYGRGTVMRTAGLGMQAKATVAFDRGGERVLLLEYAGLRVLPGGRE